MGSDTLAPGRDELDIAAGADELPVLPAIGRDVQLDDKYMLDEGLVFLTGIHALVRVVLENMRADRRAGLNTATMVSGYQGSPLGGFDKELARLHKLRGELNVVHQPALNEELGATSVWGSQIAPRFRNANYEGVTGIWYGKAPGVDRAADALRHGNFCGAHPKGGLVALCGDDPSCKSSTLPSATEATLASFGMPVLYPGSVQEVLDLGMHAIHASRASGLWVGLKVATNVADAVATALVSPSRVQPVMPTVDYQGAPYVHVPAADFLAPDSLEMERTLQGPRLELARSYARANSLCRITVDPADAWLGIVAAGTAYYELREALHAMGLDDDALRRHGIRLLKLGMIWPLEPHMIRTFAKGLEEVVVVEEKGPFVETQIRDLLYDLAERPRVIGKRDPEGMALVPTDGALDADAIARAVAPRIQRKLHIDSLEGRLRLLAERAPQGAAGAPLRTPFFCSGCPHNRSTDAPAESNVGLGIGCHTMVQLNPKGKGRVSGLTQMGGEGAQWIGQSPFVAMDHIFQNLGDGTFHHSGSLAIRAAVAGGVNITYKLLYNSAVAMTGGQNVEGVIGVPDLTRWLEIEGVKRIIVTSDDPGKYQGVELAGIAEVRDRSELMNAQNELKVEQGVTVLIHDQQCAAEKRRLRKRGKVDDPPLRAVINERVCEGCGDCGEKSDCLSVLPVDTQFGRKTRIHQASCNKDYSCLDGDCPSFLTVIPGKAKASKALPKVPVELPLPEMHVSDDEATIRMIGIGGTGVVTVAQVVGMAALVDGRRTAGLDQTGLAQKGGPVISDIRIFRETAERSNKASLRGVDAYLGFDLLGAAAARNLETADPQRTVAVVSTSQVPTGSMVTDTTVDFASLSTSLDAIDAVTLKDRNVFLDAQALSEALFDDHMPANTILLGAAWQRGLIPISLAAMEEAFRLNGSSVEKTTSAFHWGRAAVAAPDAVEAATRVEIPEVEIDPRAAEIAASVGAPDGSELAELVRVRVSELIAYQNVRYAERYAEFVKTVFEAERAVPGSGARASAAVAVGLHKLMAYKDEYEVARLHLDPVERARLRAEFGSGAKFKYKLHPPIFRALGLKQKIALGSWFDVFFRMLRGMKFLRGTKLDIFGIPKVRRVERKLIAEYRGLVEEALPHLATSPVVVAELCELPDVIRGYEEIKLRNVERFHEQAAELQARLGGEPGPALTSPAQLTFQGHDARGGLGHAARERR